ERALETASWAGAGSEPVAAAATPPPSTTAPLSAATLMVRTFASTCFLPVGVTGTGCPSRMARIDATVAASLTGSSSAGAEESAACRSSATPVQPGGASSGVTAPPASRSAVRWSSRVHPISVKESPQPFGIFQLLLKSVQSAALEDADGTGPPTDRLGHLGHRQSRHHPQQDHLGLVRGQEPCDETGRVVTFEAGHHRSLGFVRPAHLLEQTELGRVGAAPAETPEPVDRTAVGGREDEAAEVVRTAFEARQ